MKKILKWTGIVFLVLLVVLMVLPFIFKDKIVEKIKSEANASLNAKLDFAGVDLSLIRNFPNLSVTLEKLSVINVAPFQGDTLISTDKLSITLDIMSVINGTEMTIRSVSLDKAIMNFLVTKDGAYNWDIAKPSPPGAPAEPAAFKASLKRYVITDARVRYDDASLGFYLLLDGLNHTGSGDFTQDLFTLSTRTTSTSATMKYGGIPYIANANTTIDADLEMDMKNFKFTFKQNKVSLNDLNLTVDGFVAMPDTNIDMDLKLATAQTDFKTILSMIPAMYAKDFGAVQASGTMQLSAYLKGRYNASSMPGFGMVLKVNNGQFKYPSLPAAVQDVQVDLKVDNPDGVPDHTAVLLNRLHANVAGDVIDARMVLHTPVSDPDLDALLSGKINLGNVAKFYPLAQGTTLSGVMTADAMMKGRMSAMEKQDVDHFTAAGTISVANLKYVAPDVPKPVDVRQLTVQLDPKVIRMPVLDMTVGRTDLKADGVLENALGFALKDETIHGTLNLNSNTVDLSEWMTGAEDSSTASDSSAMSVVEIPGNIDFTLRASIAKLVYTDLDIRSLRGTLIIRDKAVRMQDVGMNLLDGSMTMSGSYSTVNPKSPAIDFSLDVKDFDIQKTVKSFDAVVKMAPIAKHCTGKYGTTMTLTGQLDATMSPVLNTLSGGGKLSTSTVVITGFEAFNRIADALKQPSWKKVVIPSMNPSFRFTAGRVYIDPFDVSINGYKTTVAGSNGFDQTLDYTLNTEFPRAQMGSTANAALDGIVAAANAKGANVSVGEMIPVAIGIKGTYTDPKITTGVNKAGAQAMDALKAAAKAEFEKQKAAAEAKAREEADKLKAAAAAKLDAEKAKAQAEADRLKKEAESKAKAAADEAKKKAADEAKKQLQQYNPFKKK